MQNNVISKGVRLKGLDLSSNLTNYPLESYSASLSLSVPHLQNGDTPTLSTTTVCCGDQMRPQMESHLSYDYRLWTLPLSLTKSETLVEAPSAHQ